MRLLDVEVGLLFEGMEINCPGYGRVMADFVYAERELVSHGDVTFFEIGPCAVDCIGLWETGEEQIWLAVPLSPLVGHKLPLRLDWKTSLQFMPGQIAIKFGPHVQLRDLIRSA